MQSSGHFQVQDVSQYSYLYLYRLEHTNSAVSRNPIFRTLLLRVASLEIYFGHFRYVDLPPEELIFGMKHGRGCARNKNTTVVQSGCTCSSFSSSTMWNTGVHRFRGKNHLPRRKGSSQCRWHQDCLPMRSPCCLSICDCRMVCRVQYGAPDVNHVTNAWNIEPAIKKL